MFTRQPDVWVKRIASEEIYGEGRNSDIEHNFNASESHEAQEPELKLPLALLESTAMNWAMCFKVTLLARFVALSY